LLDYTLDPYIDGESSPVAISEKQHAIRHFLSNAGKRQECLTGILVRKPSQVGEVDFT